MYYFKIIAFTLMAGVTIETHWHNGSIMFTIPDSLPTFLHPEWPRRHFLD